MRQLQLKFGQLIDTYLEGNEGATAIEYALIAAATGLALVVSLPLIENGLSSTYNSILGYFVTVGVS